MEKITKSIISTRMMAFLLLVFAIAIGTATFIENSYDTITARLVIYNTRWFSLIMLLLVINFIGNIDRYQLLKKEKFTILLVHIGLIITIVGAGVTRYIGFEGIMPIKEGENSNVMYSAEPYLQLYITDEIKQYKSEKKIYFSELYTNTNRPFYSNYFTIPVDFPNKGHFDISFKNYIKNAEEITLEDQPDGKNILELVVAGQAGRETHLVAEGEIKKIGTVLISYNNNEDPTAIRINDLAEQLTVITPYMIQRTAMPQMIVDTLWADTVQEFKPMHLHNILGTQFVFKKHYKKAIKKLQQSEDDKAGNLDALMLTLNYNGIEKDFTVMGGPNRMANYLKFEENGLLFNIAYGAKPIFLPFSIYLNDFILDRYPGSTSPSSFKSIVTLHDTTVNLHEEQEIFMNNVMDYKGYRFFQSSYEPDESGTILSVNNDYWGTLITYIGYLLLSIGFGLSLLNKKSRFVELSKRMKKIRDKRKVALLALPLLLFSLGNLNAQTEKTPPIISEEKANEFGKLLVQTFEGRIQPVHTLAYDILHKISKQNYIEIEGQKYTAMQVYMDMHVHQRFWAHQPLINIRRNTGVRELLGIEGSKASLADFYNEDNQYKIINEVMKSRQKKAVEQNVFDKELLKVDERFNIARMVLEYQFLNIFPVKDDPSNKWVNPLDSAINFKAVDPSVPFLTYPMLLNMYFDSLPNAVEQNQYKTTDGIVKQLSKFQKENADPTLLPTDSAIELEMYYNDKNIFGKLKNYYAIAGLILLILGMIFNLSVAPPKWMKHLNNILAGFIILLFAYHTYGMGIRWYLTGHAPWSNGYEALVLIAWGGVFAGLFFIRSSKVILAATAWLAFFVLMTAGHSNFDPQLTNLQPVLKSYWLNIHVAAITISYGFFGLGFILGLINMVIYLLKTPKNKKHYDLNISELTYTSEMTLTIGLVLATIGTFLGGVWANESWGRYWGWDAKETWALVIVLVYAFILHMRLVPGLRGKFAFNVASILGFSTVLMTFIGVNYYLTKGLHSYARGGAPAFPIWAWLTIAGIFLLIYLAHLKNKKAQN
ncbi:MAG: cytochrome c biogenesis protein CcsA [Flavobacteriales bacterium]|jgi:cytochrome c-type biogenesis protein CcsB|nr:cytochrome c biogenesis protein CcsA [Flavobacteriales bacterium]